MKKNTREKEREIRIYSGITLINNATILYDATFFFSASFVITYKKKILF